MTITLTREEAQQVLDVLNDVRYRIEFGQMNLSDDTDAAIETLRTRLAQPEPEPVADKYLMKVECTKCGAKQDGILTVNAPPQREWQGLTDDEIIDTANNAPFETMVSAEDYIYVISRAIEAKLKEKNA
jgi:hypothetical protein